jgi:hypothetical protein
LGIGLTFETLEKRYTWLKHPRYWLFIVWIVVLVVGAGLSIYAAHFGLFLGFIAVLFGAAIHHNYESQSTAVIETGQSAPITSEATKSFTHERRPAIEVLYWVSTFIFITFIVGNISAWFWLFASVQHSAITIENKLLVGNLILSGQSRVLIYAPTANAPNVVKCLTNLAEIRHQRVNF